MINPNNILKFIDIVLLAIILIYVIYAQIDGRFIHHTVDVIEVCNGIPNLNQTFNWSDLNLSMVGG